MDRSRADGNLQVLLSSDACGVGLNLQVANDVVHLDLPWNPARLDQRTSRAHRLGQTRGVSVTYLCAESGIERGIEGTLAGKRAVRAAALDLTSDVEELETQSFSMFLRQLRTVMEDLATPMEPANREPQVALPDVPPTAAAPSSKEPEAATPSRDANADVETDAHPHLPPATPPSPAQPPPHPQPGSARAHDRLRLAHIASAKSRQPRVTSGWRSSTEWASIHALWVGAMMGRSKTMEHDGSWQQAQGITSNAGINASFKGMADGE